MIDKFIELEYMTGIKFQITKDKLQIKFNFGILKSQTPSLRVLLLFREE